MTVRSGARIFITGATLPSMGCLQAIHTQSLGKRWEWVPWKRILSEDASVEIRAKKSQSSQDDLLKVIASSLEVLREEREDEVVGSAYRIQHILEARSNACAMCNACPLGSWQAYVKRFLCYYTKKPADSMRPPSGQEAEEADRAALTEIFELCFAGSSLDDAIHSVAVERDHLRHLLMAMPKIQKPEKPPRREEMKGRAHLQCARSFRASARPAAARPAA